jgi:uncharacterized protein
MPEKRLVIYHANCVDGFTAAWACWKAFGDGAEYLPAQYASGGSDVELPDVRGRHVIFVDFCPPRAQLLRLLEQAAVTVYDHHKTAQEACGDIAACCFDMERSGAGIAWDFFVGGDRPWLIDYVEDRDLWRWKLPQSKEVSAYISAKAQSFETWDAMTEESARAAANKGAGVLDFICRYVIEMSKHARATRFAGHDDVPVVNAPYINTSELVGHLAESARFAVGWFQRQDGLYQYSLRSRGDFDVSALAKTMGGGGHRNAAGFSCDRLPHELAEARS